MNKTYAIIIVMILFSCCKSKEGYLINGKIEGFDKGKIFLITSSNANKKIIVDSSETINGEFTFKGKVDWPRMYSIYIPEKYFNELDIQGYSPSGSFFVENSNINFLAKIDSLDYAKVTGSNSHDEYLKILEETPPLKERKILREKAIKAHKDKNYKLSQRYMHQRDSLYYLVYKKYLLKNVSKYSKSIPYSYLFWSELSNTNWEKREKAVNDFSHEISKSFYLRQIKEDIEKFKKVAIGKQSPDFTINDTLGNPVKLSSFRGKYVLLDFWASWCRYCRYETPNIKKAYSKYRDKGFEVIGISYDTKKDAWLKAIKEDKASWIQVSALKGWKCNTTRNYHIKGIPHCVLIDPNGKIVAKNLRGKDFENKLDEIFKNK